MKSAAEAATTGQRFWRTLRFVDPANPLAAPGARSSPGRRRATRWCGGSAMPVAKPGRGELPAAVAYFLPPASCPPPAPRPGHRQSIQAEILDTPPRRSARVLGRHQEQIEAAAAPATPWVARVLADPHILDDESEEADGDETISTKTFRPRKRETSSSTRRWPRPFPYGGILERHAQGMLARSGARGTPIRACSIMTTPRLLGRRWTARCASSWSAAACAVSWIFPTRYPAAVCSRRCERRRSPAARSPSCRGA